MEITRCRELDVEFKEAVAFGEEAKDATARELRLCWGWLMRKEKRLPV